MVVCTLVRGNTYVIPYEDKVYKFVRDVPKEIPPGLVALLKEAKEKVALVGGGSGKENSSLLLDKFSFDNEKVSMPSVKETSADNESGQVEEKPRPVLKKKAS